MCLRYAKLVWLVIIAFAIGGTSCQAWHSSSAGPEQGVSTQAKDPTATLPTSLHGTAGGMRWWYEQPDGFGDYSGVSYDDAGCGHCHISSCDQCHEDAAGTKPVAEPESCGSCHGRIKMEDRLQISDVHFDAEMSCSHCHSSGEMHGNGIQYDSMLSPGAMDTKCDNCHADLTSNAEHEQHGADFHCDTCHLESVITCYNCHFETLIKEHKKKTAGAFNNYIILLNDRNGKLRAGTYQSVVYGDKTFVAFGPYHGHSVMSEGRSCKDCHSSERMLEMRDTGKVVMTTWDARHNKVKHTTGVIPFVPEKLEFQFVALENGKWKPLTKETGRSQHEFCTPLTERQLKVLGATR